jgi:hypothetical protein
MRTLHSKSRAAATGALSCSKKGHFECVARRDFTPAAAISRAAAVPAGVKFATNLIDSERPAVRGGMPRGADSAFSGGAAPAGAERGMKTPVRTSSGTIPLGGGASGARGGSGPESGRLEVAPFDSQAGGVRSLLRVVLSPGSEMLEATHAFATSYVTNRLQPQAAQRVSVAAYELIANALAYSTMSEDITFEVFESERQIAIRVSNQTISARISMLTEHVAKVRQNPEQALTDEMRRSVSGGPRPMLGLARVVHEASLSLEVSVDGRRVTVTASGRR